MNDNYKLMAEISNENLRLAGEKLRVEKVLEEANKERDSGGRRARHHQQQWRMQNKDLVQQGKKNTYVQ